MVTSKELVRQAIRFQNPERIPLANPYDPKSSDIVYVDVVQNFLGPQKRRSEWGFEWSHLDNDLMMGQPKAPVLKSWSDLKDYRPPDPHDPRRFETARMIRAEFGDDKYYKGNFVLSGFAVMTALRGFSETLEDLYLERENIERLADIVFGFEEEVIELLKPEGIDCIGFADDWGTQENLFISPKLWREIFKPRYKRQIELAHECGLDLFFHSCGYIYDLIPDFIEIGLDILNPGQPNLNNINRIGENFSGRLCFACPVSYQTTGITGNQEDIQREVRELVGRLGNRGGGLIGVIPMDIVNLGAKTENIRYMVEAFQRN